MNLLQIARKARFEVDAIRTGNVVSALWSDEEVYSAINTAIDSANRIMRLAGSDIAAKAMESDDAVVDLITESYNPASLRITDGTRDYTLPPDFVSVIQIVGIEDGFEDVRFRPLRTSQRLYADQRAILTADVELVQNNEAIFYYVILGNRTLRVVPTPSDTFHIELTYNYRPPKLLVYSTGTVGTAGVPSTTVTGTGTDWLNAGVRTPAELVTGAVATAVDLGLYYPEISTVSSATSVTMRKSQTIADGTVYRIAMVPVLPGEHHNWLAQMAAAIMYRKVNLETANQAGQQLEKQLLAEVQPEIGMRQMQESIPAEPAEMPNF